MRPSVRLLLAWCLFIPLGILNGLSREFLLVPMLGAEFALPVSALTLAALILLVTRLLRPWLGPLLPARAWGVGVAWLLLTIAFEFLFGLAVAGKTFAELLRAYDPRSGNLWLLVLLVILLAPRLLLAREKAHVRA